MSLLVAWVAADGVWVWSGLYKALGPGDWPGTVEGGLVGEWRLATEEEWSAATGDE